jgi:hypothetical protein
MHIFLIGFRVHYQAAVNFGARNSLKKIRWGAGMKNIILPLCPLWFFESLTTGKN